MKNKLLVIPLILLSFFLQAQEVVLVSKSDVISKVKENNNTIKMSQQDVLAAKGDFNQTNAVFLPNITASHTGISTTNPLMAFGSKLNQEILTQNDFNPALLNDPSTTRNFATKIEIQQPLINLDGFYQRKAAKSKMNAMYLKTERTVDYMSFEVEKSYMQLQLAYKGVAVLERALTAANEHKKIADNRFNQGFLQRADVLNVEVRVTEVKNQLQTAKSNVQNASNYVSFLMNDKNYVVYRPTDSLTVSNFNVDNKIISESRSDIKAMQLASEAYKAMNKADKMAFLPRLNAFGSYEMYDNKVFKGDANGYLIGAQLSWGLFKGAKRFGKAQKSKAEFEKSKLAYNEYVSKSNLEFNKVKRQLLDAKNSLNLTDLAVQQSKESLRIRKNRFKEGLEKTSDLLIAKNKICTKAIRILSNRV